MLPSSTKEFHTGEKVPGTGRYICDEGELKDLKEGEAFPACPKTGEPTNWQQYLQE